MTLPERMLPEHLEGKEKFLQGALHLMLTQGLRVQSSCPLTLDELLTVGSEAGADFTVDRS